jgi:hypothetical protein
VEYLYDKAGYADLLRVIMVERFRTISCPL